MTAIPDSGSTADGECIARSSIWCDGSGTVDLTDGLNNMERHLPTMLELLCTSDMHNQGRASIPVTVKLN